MIKNYKNPLLVIWLEKDISGGEEIPITGVLLHTELTEEAKLFSNMVKAESEDWEKERFYVIPFSENDDFDSILIELVSLLTKFDECITMYPESFILSGKELLHGY